MDLVHKIIRIHHLVFRIDVQCSLQCLIVICVLGGCCLCLAWGLSFGLLRLEVSLSFEVEHLWVIVFDLIYFYSVLNLERVVEEISVLGEESVLLEQISSISRDQRVPWL